MEEEKSHPRYWKSRQGGKGTRQFLTALVSDQTNRRTSYLTATLLKGQRQALNEWHDIDIASQHNRQIYAAKQQTEIVGMWGFPEDSRGSRSHVSRWQKYFFWLWNIVKDANETNNTRIARLIMNPNGLDKLCKRDIGWFPRKWFWIYWWWRNYCRGWRDDVRKTKIQ